MKKIISLIAFILFQLVCVAIFLDMKDVNVSVFNFIDIFNFDDDSLITEVSVFLFLVGGISSLISVIKNGSSKVLLMCFYLFTPMIDMAIMFIIAIMSGSQIDAGMVEVFIGLVLITSNLYYIYRYNLLWSKKKKVVFIVIQSLFTALLSFFILVSGWLSIKDSAMS